MTNYQEMAIDFLEETGTECVIRFDACKKYFPDDTKRRNVYDVTLRRKVDGVFREYSFKFGDSIYNTKNRILLDEYSVLACLVKYNPGTLDDFCDEFGYRDSNLKISEIIKIHHDAVKEWKMVQLLFSDVLDELQEIQ